MKRWSKFTITLVVEGWDEKWVYHRQIFQQNGEVCAIGFTKLAFWKNKKTQNIRRIIADSGVQRTKMNPSVEVVDMFKNDFEIIKSQD
jgi:hypothetical protein